MPETLLAEIPATQLGPPVRPGLSNLLDFQSVAAGFGGIIDGVGDVLAQGGTEELARIGFG